MVSLAMKLLRQDFPRLNSLLFNYTSAYFRTFNSISERRGFGNKFQQLQLEALPEATENQYVNYIHPGILACPSLTRIRLGYVASSQPEVSGYIRLNLSIFSLRSLIQTLTASRH